MSYWGQQRALRKQWLGLVREVLEKQLDPQARRGLELIRSVLAAVRSEIAVCSLD